MPVKNNFLKLLSEKGIRESRRISIAEVSRNTSIDQRTLGAWARNSITRFDANVISSLCGYFECTVCDILDYLPDSPTE